MRRFCCCRKYRDRYRDLENEDSDSDELASRRPDRGDPDGGDSDDDHGSCDSAKTASNNLNEFVTENHPTFNLPSPFKAIDLRNGLVIMIHTI